MPAGPLVSVIVPTYNRSAYIGHAIQSIVCQTHRNLEVLVVDDGSTDDTCNAVKRFVPRVRYLRQEHAGVSAARNNGLRHATGEFVSFLDSDDVWHPEKTAIQLRDLEEFPGAVLHCTNAQFVERDGQRIDLFSIRGVSVAEGLVYLAQPFDVVFRCGLASLPCMMVRLNTARQSSEFSTRLCIYEDLEWLSRLALKGGMVLRSNVLAEFHRRSEEADLSLTERVKGRTYTRQLILLSIVRSLCDEMTGNDSQLATLCRYRSDRYFALGLVKAITGSRKRSWSWLRKSCRSRLALRNVARAVCVAIPGGWRLYNWLR